MERQDFLAPGLVLAVGVFLGEQSALFPTTSTVTYKAICSVRFSHHFPQPASIRHADVQRRCVGRFHCGVPL